MCNYSTDFLVVRRAVFWNLIARNAPFREEDLTPAQVVKFIEMAGEDYVSRNKRGVTLPPRNPNVDSKRAGRPGDNA